MAIAAMMGSLVGCAADGELPRLSSGPVVGNQGDAYELVFPTQGVATQLASASAADGAVAPELSRRDDALGAGSMQPRLALDSWADPQRPAFHRPVYFTLPRSDRQFVTFRAGGHVDWNYRSSPGPYRKPWW